MPFPTPDEQTWNRTFAAQVIKPMQAVVRAARQQGIHSRVHLHGPLTASLSLYPAGSETVVADFLVQKTPEGWLIRRMRHVPVQGTDGQQLEVPGKPQASLPTSSWLLSELRRFVGQEQEAGMLNPRGKLGSYRAARRAQGQEAPQAATGRSVRK